MIANYHTHTTRCHHAEGEDRQYVETAIERGLRILGFSDHTPYYYDGDYVSGVRMLPEEVEGYVESIQKLKDEYKSQIEIKLGFETEYYPKYFEKLLQLYAQYPVDYIILGQHFLNNEVGEIYTGRPEASIDRIDRYADQVIEAIHTGCFTYLAHPDLCLYEGDSQRYRNAMKRICLAAKEAGLPLEINLLGMRTNRHYPKKDFFRIAADCGCTIVLGSDAHRPEDVTDPASEQTARGWVKELGLTLLETVPLSDGKERKNIEQRENVAETKKEYGTGRKS